MEMPRRVETMLVVDDDEAIRRAFARVQSCRVVAAGSLAEALELARAEPVGSAVVDLHLGAESGLAIVEALRKRDPSMPIIVMTGQLSSALGFEAARAGADLVLDKPVTVSELIAHVHTLSARPRAVSLHDHRDAYIARMLDACDGNRSEAARRLGIRRYSLQRILARSNTPAGRRGRRKKQR